MTTFFAVFNDFSAAEAELAFALSHVALDGNHALRNTTTDHKRVRMQWVSNGLAMGEV